jgi:hypothetical protein
MPEGLLQNRNCVAAMQQPPHYTGCMSTKPDEQHTTKHTGPPPRASRRQGRPRWTVAIGAALAWVALLAAACGGGSTSTTAPPTSQGGSNSTDDAVAYSQCMHAHGVPNFPDPDPNTPWKPFGAATLAQAGVDTSTPQFQAAARACARLQPAVTPAQQQQLLSLTLRFVACMRAHGVPNFPDPSTVNGEDSLSLTPSVVNSPHYQSAEQACRSIAPFLAVAPDSPKTPK